MQVSSFRGLSRTTRGKRRGATLVIVVALFGLLAFTAMVFYSFASQERAAAESVSEAAKYVVERPDEVFDHMLRHVSE
jgi:flagellar basal body-associated protein FliL